MSALTHFCPSCWSEITAETSVCFVCGTDIEEMSAASYEQKLLQALYHPEPTVPVRAATILGQLGSTRAVEPLIQLVALTPDPYLQEAAIRSLGQIGDARALSLLNKLRREGPVRVRIAANEAMAALSSETNRK
jgi:HEAT repeat protein